MISDPINPQVVTCPKCGAGVGLPCPTGTRERPGGPHIARVRYATLVTRDAETVSAAIIKGLGA